MIDDPDSLPQMMTEKERSDFIVLEKL